MVKINDGEPIELLTPLSEENRNADAHAFAALMKYTKEVDSNQRTVIMIQVENEVGVLRDSRDRSSIADEAYNGPVPQELMSYIEKNKDTFPTNLTSDQIKKSVVEQLKQQKMVNASQSWLVELNKNAQINYFVSY